VTSVETGLVYAGGGWYGKTPAIGFAQRRRCAVSEQKPFPTGGPAFPVENIYLSDGQIVYGPNGMSLRDYFAGQALGVVNNSSMGKFSYMAQLAYRLADEMLAERSKGGAR